MSIDIIKSIKEFRQITGLGLLESKKYLEQSEYDMDKAIDTYRNVTGKLINSRAHKETNQGLIYSYIHTGGLIGVLVEVNCETDFVAKSDQFISFVKNVALQVAATNPTYLSRDEIPVSVINNEKSIAEYGLTHLPPAAQARAVGGRLDKFYSTTCLMDQVSIKYPDKTINQMVNELISSTKENIRVRRFVRYQLGR